MAGITFSPTPAQVQQAVNTPAPGESFKPNPYSYRLARRGGQSYYEYQTGVGPDGAAVWGALNAADQARVGRLAGRDLTPRGAQLAWESQQSEANKRREAAAANAAGEDAKIDRERNRRIEDERHADDLSNSASNRNTQQGQLSNATSMTNANIRGVDAGIRQADRAQELQESSQNLNYDLGLRTNSINQFNAQTDRDYRNGLIDVQKFTAQKTAAYNDAALIAAERDRLERARQFNLERDLTERALLLREHAQTLNAFGDIIGLAQAGMMA